MTPESSSLGDEFMALMGDALSYEELMTLMGYELNNPDDAEMSHSPSVQLDATWPSNLFDTQFPAQFSQPEYLSSLPLGEPGPSGSQEGSSSFSYYPPVDWSPQPEYEPATGSNVTTSATPPVIPHEYYRLAGREEEILDTLLEVSEASKPGRKTFQCRWQGCTEVPFTGKCQAHTHVCKHLGFKKLYGCVACHMQFSTRGAAKRHCESQQASFSCSICLTVIKRKDYWRKHERICANKN